MSTESVYASIITIGDELLIGQTIDTNSAFIAQELNKIGIWVRRRVAVGDLAADIRQALDEERNYSSVIIITGGLGPTADDITKPLLCDYFGGKLVIDDEVLAHVRHLFKNVYLRTGPILQRNLDQALVPDVCTVLHNANGSAPGMWFDVPADASLNATASSGQKVFVSLPGVPHEMKGLIRDEVIPRLLNKFTLPAIVHRTAFTAGQGESMLAESISQFEASLPAHIKLAYLPSYGMVRLRLTARGTVKEELEKEITPYFLQLQEQVKEYLVTNEDEGLEVTVGKLLNSTGKTIGTAESCTGGYIAHLITSVAGSSAYFNGSVVSYSNDLKKALLGVKEETLSEHGAVSQKTVEEMALGARKNLGVDFALATSGIMGPGGGSEAKPVGTVWIAVASEEGVQSLKLNLRQDRQRNISIASLNALNFLRKCILSAN